MYLTIANTSDSTIVVCVESANANAIDELIVTNGSGSAISDIDSTSIAGKWFRTLTWSGTVPDSVALNVLWSNTGIPGNAQLLAADGNFAIADTCGSFVPPAPTPDTASVTFQVDMSMYGSSFTQVAVAGTFNGWSGTANALTDQGNGIWSGTVDLWADTMYEFKYFLDSSATQEMFAGGESCTVTNFGFTNRGLQVTGDTTLNLVCWEACDTCGAPLPGDTTMVTVSVDMSNYGNAFTQVYLSGSFNGWSGTADPLTDQGNGVWSGTVSIYADSLYEYKFTHDDWIGQESFNGSEPCVVSIGPFPNRGLEVTGDSVLSTVCWDMCDSCMVLGDTTQVTFSVDMSNYTTPFTQVYVSGSFNGWSGNGDPLTDQGNGIWSGTAGVYADSLMEYKFTHDNWVGQENFTGSEPCVVNVGPFPNRGLTVTGDSVLSTVCWNSCDSCGMVSTPDSVNVTFQVDMSEYTTAFTEANLNGIFNGWCGACAPMTDQGNGVWDLTVYLPANTTTEYKFTVDGWTDDEQFTGQELCTGPPAAFVNRVLNIGANDTTLNLVCFNSCDTCGAAPPDTVDVTFQVDMQDYFGAFAEIDVNGTWNAWCGTCNPLTDQGNGIWSATYPIVAGQHEFKFTVDGWTDQEMFNGGEPCTITNGGNTNRLLLLSSDTTLGLVCFNSCDACPPDTGFTVSASFGAVSCTDSVTQVTLLTMGGTSPYTYAWSNGGNTPPQTVGTYSVTVTDATGATAVANNIMVSAVDQVSASLSVTDATSSTSNDGAIDLTVTGGTTPYLYAWSNSETTEDVSGLAAGTYTVTVTDDNGCTTTATGDVMSTGIADVLEASSVSLFPNPASNNVTLTAAFKRATAGVVVMRDLSGRTVLQRNFAGPVVNMQIALESFRPGVYFIAIETKEGSLVRKLAVME